MRQVDSTSLITPYPTDSFFARTVVGDRIRSGLVYSTLLVGALAIGEMIRSGFSVDVFIESLPWWLISLAVSFVFGTWVFKIIEESRHVAS